MSESHKQYRFSEERRQQYSERFRGERNPFYGKAHTDQSRAKIRAGRKGQPSPKKGKPAPVGCWQGRLKTYILIDPAGREYVVDHLTAFCAEHSLAASNLRSVLAGRLSHHKGWRIRRA